VRKYRRIALPNRPREQARILHLLVERVGESGREPLCHPQAHPLRVQAHGGVLAAQTRSKGSLCHHREQKQETQDCRASYTHYAGVSFGICANRFNMAICCLPVLPNCITGVSS